MAVKPFLPQLQRTFARGLADTSSETLRNRAAKGLGILITLTPRVDPLIAELIAGSKTPDLGVKNAMMKALQEVVGKAGASMSEASRTSILGLIDDDSSDQNGEFNLSQSTSILQTTNIHLQTLLPLPTRDCSAYSSRSFRPQLQSLSSSTSISDNHSFATFTYNA